MKLPNSRNVLIKAINFTFKSNIAQMLMKCYEVVGKRYKPPLASLKIITNFALGNDTTSSLKRFF